MPRNSKKLYFSGYPSVKIPLLFSCGNRRLNFFPASSLVPGVNSANILSQNAQSPQHRNMNFMNTKIIQYKFKTDTSLPNKTKRRTMIMMINYHKGYETTVNAFCFVLLTMYRFPNRFVLTQRKRPNFSSIFLFRVILAAIISSNRNLFALKLYSGTPACEARQRSTMGKKIDA